jgi:hypothetical protein
MRKRYIQDRFSGEMIDADEYVRHDPDAPLVMKDIAPYKSMIDGSEITSRSKHREHLRQHDCIEVGNEVKHLKPYGNYEAPKGLKDTLIRLANEKLR